jgi:valyl-tRNA synthetase
MSYFQGWKMSKTLGNVIDPLDTIKEFGTDALRFTISLGTAGQVSLLSYNPLNCSFKTKWHFLKKKKIHGANLPPACGWFKTDNRYYFVLLIYMLFDPGP